MSDITDEARRAHDDDRIAHWVAEDGLKRLLDEHEVLEDFRAAALAGQGDKPGPCVMTHTPPFDFAQCETHDETFPLGGVCKWHGKASVAEVLQDEVDEQRMRAIRAEHQLEILLTEQGETAWEYGWNWASHPNREPMSLEGDAAARSREIAEIERHIAPTEIFRRTPEIAAGEWLPVPETTNTEEGM